MENKTLGEKRVRVDFNVAGSEVVDQIKIKSAELIDLVGSLPVESGPSEKSRLIALAQTTYEEATMWAVKAATA